jgi:hypothetical protein
MLMMIGSLCTGAMINRYPWFIPSPFSQNQQAESTSQQVVTVQPGSECWATESDIELGKPILDITERDLPCIDHGSMPALVRCS